MSDLDKAFELFKANPAAETEPQDLKHQNPEQIQAQTIKPKRRTPEFKTRKGGVWDKRLAQILELFTALDWEVMHWKSNRYVEAWKITNKNLDQAILYLSSNGFSMGGKKPNEVLKGEFDGYEEQDRFDDFLVSNGIEVEE